MANVDTIRVFSDPFKPSRAFYIARPFIESWLAQEKKWDGKKLDNILEESLVIDDHNASALGIYKEYNKKLIENAPKIKEMLSDHDLIVFLTGISPDATTEGVRGRVGYDAFSQLYNLSAKILELSCLEDRKNAYSKTIFWPITPTIDMPFVCIPDERRIRAIFSEETLAAGREMISKNKKGFGTLEKSLDRGELEKGAFGNYQFAERLISFREHQKMISANPLMLQDMIDGYGEEKVSLASDYIAFHRKIAVEKYKTLFELFGLEDFFRNLLYNKRIGGVPYYAIKGSATGPILEKTLDSLGLGLYHVGNPKAKGILRNVKWPSSEMTSRELAPSALAILDGFISNFYSLETKRLYTKKPETPPASVIMASCPQRSMIKCEHSLDCGTIEQPRRCTAEMISDYISKEMPGALELLEKDATKYTYGIAPIEYFLLKILKRDFEIVNKDRRWALRNLVQDKRFLPLCFDEAKVGSYDLRASEFATECMLGRILNKVDKEKLKEIAKQEGVDIITTSDQALIGILTHMISNQQPKSWPYFEHNRLLSKIENGLELPRDSWCEKTVLYDCGGIRVAGHPDATVYLKDPNKNPSEQDLGILDIKHLVYSESEKEKKGYLDQALVYSLALEQMLGMKPNHYYTFFIKRPFAMPRENEKVVDAGCYRDQRLSMWYFGRDDERIEELNKKIKTSYDIQQDILNNNLAMYAAKTESKLCGGCFDKTTCNYIFEKMKEHSSLKSLFSALNLEYPTTVHRSKSSWA